MLRDLLLARLADMGDEPDYVRLAAEVLAIRGAPPALARRLVMQALVIEDRQDAWARAGERICASAPVTPGVYILRDEHGDAMYVGKALNLRRRLRAHFAPTRWRSLPPALARVADAEWEEIGSELVALLREAELIAELAPPVNVQTAPPRLDTRDVPRSLVRDVLLVVRSIEEDSADLVGARTDGGWMVQRTRRDGSDLAVHVARMRKFFSPKVAFTGPALAPIVFSWLAGRGAPASRIDPHDEAPRLLRGRVESLLRDDALFVERVDQRRR